MPHPEPEPDDVIPAADPGPGASSTPETGVGGEEPDQTQDPFTEVPSSAGSHESAEGPAAGEPKDTPFRTPTPEH